MARIETDLRSFRKSNSTGNGIEPPSEAGEQVALGFIEALEHAYLQLASQPAIGSPRYAHELNLPGLRSWPLQRYPYLLFYVDLPNHIDVWRVLHNQRDIPAWLHEDHDTRPGEPL